MSHSREIKDGDEVDERELAWQEDEKNGCHCRQPHHLPIWHCPVHGEVTVPMD